MGGTGDRYGFRAFHIDCSRHFFAVPELKKMIAAAAEFGFNYFHWHISDDQGYRLESRRFPRLHEISSVRKGDHFAYYFSDRQEGGYYTFEDVREILECCDSHGIEVIPELDVPGHVSAILAAYPELSCSGEETEVVTSGGIFHGIFCPAKEEVYAFLEALLGELIGVFPGEYFHIGGDEVPHENWESCPLCREKMKRMGISDMRAYQGAFENRIAGYLLEKGKKVIAWNDAADGGNLDPRIILQYWATDRDERLAEHLRKGGDIIISPTTHCYFDYPYGITSLKKAYETDLNPEGLREALRLGKGRVLGTEGLLWTEHIRTPQKLEEYAWPRLAAIAAVAKYGEDRPPFEDFLRDLKEKLPALEALGITVHPEEDWVPDEAESTRQREEFYRNYDEEAVRRFQEEASRGGKTDGVSEGI